MRIIARSTLTRFIHRLAGNKGQNAVKASLDAWFHEARRATWTRSSDVKKLYASASVVGAGRVVFNIKGNDYRLVAAIDYQRGIVFIKWVGTHADYDKIEARKVQYADQAHQEQRRS